VLDRLRAQSSRGTQRRSNDRPNNFDRNPRYASEETRHNEPILFRDSSDCTLTGFTLCARARRASRITLERCDDLNLET